MKRERQIDKIIHTHLYTLSTGEESIASIVEKYPHLAAELQPRLEAAVWLNQLKQNTHPRPGYVQSSRLWLVEQITSQRPSGYFTKLFRRHSPARLAFNFAAPIILMLVLALVINSALLFTRLSIPGEPFYQAKLFIEGVRLALTFDPVQKTNLHAQFAQERTTEFVELVLQGDYDLLPSAAARLETEIIHSLRAMKNIPADDLAAHQTMLAYLRDALSNEILMLDVLKQTTPSSAHPGIELAINAAQSGILALR